MTWRSIGGVAAFCLVVLALASNSADAQPGLIPNANVETDGDANGIPDDWFHSSGVSYPDDNGPSRPGQKSIQLDSAGQDWRSQTFIYEQGAQYHFQFDYLFLPGATGGFRADFRFFDGNIHKGEHAPAINVSNIGTWQTYSALVTAPVFSPDVPGFPNNSDVRVSSNLFVPGNGLVRFDNWLVFQVPEPTSAALLGLSGIAFAMVGRRSRRALQA
jgi:hypothetical protein